MGASAVLLDLILDRAVRSSTGPGGPSGRGGRSEALTGGAHRLTISAQRLHGALDLGVFRDAFFGLAGELPTCWIGVR